MLRKELKNFPDSVCFMITDEDITNAPMKPEEVCGWCISLGIKRIIFHIDTDSAESVFSYLDEIRKISGIAHLNLCCDGKTEVSGKGAEVSVAIGMSGRDEIVNAIKQMAKDGVNPESVDEKKIESYLNFKFEPDLVIKAGGSHLTDFLIWQSVYSELFFLDVNWKGFRKIDLLRALRDYQLRKRRYGK
ncbi:undecaprenyl diphosphate synthase [Methanomicrobium sp. W14]|uniref:undecaprenyl diphosphate synthase family protein n=1 Tax=Methanomicrobium sp. W14 TaxID=2817839 RepID=UPI001FD93DC7|nr:undecaprenyl diphosphate synthase family protein [Methanomicrobium sp. W14]MBP2132084.1 undecaprenyl diphosphate synthase [Methanomicrobium sp. W14]